MEKNYTKEELNSMKRDDVRKVAKEFKVTKWGKMAKSEMIEAIIDLQMKSEGEQNMEENSVNKCETKEEEVNVERGSSANENKMKYIENIKPGTLVAFKTMVMGKERVKSAAVVNVSKKRRMLKLSTKYGLEFVVSFDDVVWVKTNSRWPKFVYEMFKNNRKSKSEVDTDANEVREEEAAEVGNN